MLTTQPFVFFNRGTAAWARNSGDEKARRVIDENVHACEGLRHRVDHVLDGGAVAQIRFEGAGACGTYGVQLVAQRLGVIPGSVIVQGDAHSLAVQAANDFGADAARTAGDDGDVRGFGPWLGAHGISRRLRAATGRL
jgi:hypothetical protein